MRTKFIKLLSLTALLFGVSVSNLLAAFANFDHVGGGATGSVTDNGGGSYTLIGGGNDIWDTTDEFDFANSDQTGDFDVRVRVESVQAVARWTKAGIMAREDLTTGSRMAFPRVTPDDVPTSSGGDGANDTRYAYRRGSGGVDGAHEDCTDCGVQRPYPVPGGGLHNWVRLQRAGDMLIAYSSPDGCTWTPLSAGENTATWPGGSIPTWKLGLAVSRHSGSSATAQVEFRQYGDVLNDAATISQHPANALGLVGATATFSVQVAGGCDAFTFDWRRNGASLGAASQPSYTTPILSLGDDADYDVVIVNTINSSTTTSTTGHLTVIDSPIIVSVGNRCNPNAVYVTWSKPVTLVGSYSIPGLTVGAISHDGANTSVVVVQTSTQTEDSTYTVTATGESDGANVQTPNPASASWTHGATTQKVRIIRRKYSGIGGVNLADLYASPNYPNNPSEITYPATFESLNPDSDDNYGVTVSGIAIVPVTGMYKFYMSADDQGGTFLSTDANPANAVMICSEPVWNGNREYITGSNQATRGSPPANISSFISLVVGERRYLEARMKEGGGGDNLAVAVEIAGIQAAPVNGQAGIPESYFEIQYRIKAGQQFNNYGPVVVVSSTGGGTFNENATVTLTAVLDGSPPYNMQWCRNGDPILGANGATLTFAATRDDDLDSFVLKVSNEFSSASSAPAVIDVLFDDVPPTIAGSSSDASLASITICFSEPVNPTYAADPFNYMIDGGLAIDEPSGFGTMSPDNRCVTFHTTAQTPGQTYVITVNSVEDLAAVPNQIAPNSLTQFTAWEFAPCVVRRDLYQGVGGVSVAELISHPSYPNSPSSTSYESLIEGPRDAFDSYGTRVSGFIVPLISGPYRFWISSDDGGAFYLSSDENPANQISICTEPGWNGFREFAAGGNQASRGVPAANDSETLFAGGINLVAGQRYSFTALAHEGGGGDNLAVAMQAPGGAPVVNGTTSIGGLNVGTYVAPGTFTATISISQHPQPQMKLQNQTASFNVVASSSNGEGLLYQWYKNNDAIPGANGASYTTPPVSLGDDGSLYCVEVCIRGRSVRSNCGLLSVNQDAEPPLLERATGSRTLDHVTIKFNELVNPADATDAFNYSIDGLTIDEPTGFGTMGADGMSVTFLTSGQASGATYRVHVSGVKDLAENLIAEDSQIDFTAFVKSCGFALREFYFGRGGVNISDLRSDPNYPNNPGLVNYAGLIEAPVDNLQNGNVYDNYGVRVSGFVVPPTTGDYTFYISADDAAEFWLSTDTAPANMVMLCREPIWAASRVWTGEANGGGRGAPPANISVLVPLVAGQCYYFEALMKEGGGGDNMAVAWQKPGDPVPVNGSTPIEGRYLALMADPTGAYLNIDSQPSDRVHIINPYGGSSSGTPLASENFDAGDGGCTVANTGEPFEGPWTYDGGSGSWKSDGQGPELSRPSSTRLTCPPITVTTSGEVQLSFDHRYSFEAGAWDGGQVLVSISGGPFTVVPASAFSANGYNGAVIAGSSSGLSGQSAFIETSPGYGGGLITSVCNLGFVGAGNTVTLQFLAANDTNTRNLSPQWEISATSLTQGISGPTTAFNAVLSASGPIVYQWYRGGNAIPGANGPNLVLNPTLADNGACFELRASSPGVACPGVITRTACLTVLQPNTPPAFVCGPSQSPMEDDGPHTVPGWATGIIHHSIPRVSIAYGSDFASAPPGSSVQGSTYIGGGVLHLTDAVNSQQGIFFTPSVGGATIESFTATFKLRIGPGTSCGGRPADGLSFSFGNDLVFPPPVAGEEGTGNGLRVNLDTWDNGGTDEAPCLDIKFGPGAPVIAFQSFAGIREGGRPPAGPLVIDPATSADMTFGTGAGFTDVSINLDADGTLDVDFKGVRLINNLPTGYTPISNARIGLMGRTGGCNDEQWVDDLSFLGFTPDASGAEAGQTVSFLTTNDRPEKFTQQPSVSSDGTLSYATAPDACGPVYVTVIARDSGGTANGGDDTSTPCTFLIDIACKNDCPTTDSTIVYTAEDTAAPVIIPNGDVDGDALTLIVLIAPGYGTLSGDLQNGLVYTPNANYCGPDAFTYQVTDGQCLTEIHPGAVFVTCVNDCPVAQGYAVTLTEDTSAPTPVTASDADGDSVSIAIVSGPAHGTLSGSGAGTTYTPAHNYCGPDSFTFEASDGRCPVTATVAINVTCVNEPPTCNIVVSPLFKLTPDVTECVLLSCNNDDADAVLDASLSTDEDGDTLTYVWLDNGVPIGTDMVSSNALDVGTHVITLIVSDGTDSATCTKTVQVIDLCEAVSDLVGLTEGSTISRKNKKPLIEALKNACKYYEKNHCKEGNNGLKSFQAKVNEYKRKRYCDAATATRLINAAEAILDGCPDCVDHHHHRCHWWKPKSPAKRPTRNSWWH